MNFLLVTSNGVHYCSSEGVCRSVDAEAAGDTLSMFEVLRPDGVVFLGVMKPNPIEFLCDLRTRGESVRAAIVRSEEELHSTSALTKRALTDAFWRFRSLFHNGKGHLQRAGRKIFIDLRAREVSVAGKSLTFSPMEFRLLVFLLRYPGVIFSRQELLERTRCSESTVDHHIVDVLVRRIRMKIEVDLHSPEILLTARGLGYECAERRDVFVDQITGREFVSWPCPKIEK
jgi:hypothetical protein